MKKLILIALFCVTIFSCGESKTLLDQATDLRCECLSKYDKENDNLMEILSCLDEIANNRSFAGLNPKDVAKEMEKKCSENSLPMEILKK